MANSQLLSRPGSFPCAVESRSVLMPSWVSAILTINYLRGNYTQAKIIDLLLLEKRANLFS